MFFAPALRTRVFSPARGFDRSFERFLNEAFSGPAHPGVTVRSDEQSWTLSLDLPGVAREQLAIDVDGAVVRVQTVADAPRQYQGAWQLPEDIDADATTARLENGVLTLTLGKKKPVVTARTIQVQ